MATSFYLGKRPDKAGDLPIIVSISVRGQRLLTSLGFSIHPDKWDSGRQEVKRGCWNSRKISYSIINARIKAVSSAVLDFEMVTKERPSRSQLASLLAGVKGERGIGADREKPISAYLEEFIIEESERQQWTNGTIIGMRSFAKHLKEYNPSGLDSLDGDGALRFLGYLRNQLGMRETTIRKNWSALRWFMSWAHRKDYYKPVPFSDTKPKFKIVPPTVVFLDAEELDRLFRLELPDNGTTVRLKDADGQEYEKTISCRDSLLRVRDVFCFCCATSLRYSDVARLKKGDIQDGAIRFTTKKTSTPLTIELNPISSAIVERYKDYHCRDGLALPVIEPKRMNIHLRTVCELAGINAPVTKTYYKAGRRVDETAPKWAYITTHAGRRTFICYALSQGIPPQIVMKWTGHSDYKAMKPYIDVAGVDKARAMEKLFQ